MTENGRITVGSFPFASPSLGMPHFNHVTPLEKARACQAGIIWLPMISGFKSVFRGNAMKHLSIIAASCAGWFCVLFPQTAASQNLLINGSFESGNFTNESGGYDRLLVGSSDLSGWSILVNEVAWGGPLNVDSIVPSDGSYFLDLTSFGRVNPIGAISQTIATTPGAIYRVTLDLFNPVDMNAIGVRVDAGTASMVLNSTGGFEFTASGSSTPITITGVAAGAFLGLDNVEVVQVPEPSSVLLFAASYVTLAGLFMRRRSCSGSR